MFWLANVWLVCVLIDQCLAALWSDWSIFGWSLYWLANAWLLSVLIGQCLAGQCSDWPSLALSVLISQYLASLYSDWPMIGCSLFWLATVWLFSVLIGQCLAGQRSDWQVPVGLSVLRLANVWLVRCLIGKFQLDCLCSDWPMFGWSGVWLASSSWIVSVLIGQCLACQRSDWQVPVGLSVCTKFPLDFVVFPVLSSFGQK